MIQILWEQRLFWEFSTSTYIEL